MEDAKALQQQLLLQHQQQQQFLFSQQFQKQAQHQQQQASAISRFPSNIDAHLRPPGITHRPFNLQQSATASPNPNSTPVIPNSHQNQQNPNLQQQAPQQAEQQQQQQQQQRGIRSCSPVELQMAYQDAWRVCHPDFKRPFSSLEDACERLIPYHVVADYEAEEDDRILESCTSGQALSRSQQWDQNIAAKVAEFTATFEKQALAFNIINKKRAVGEFRAEERLMVEQALLQDERRAMMELRAEMESREKMGRENQLRMAAMVQAEQARAESHAHAEMMNRGPVRPNAFGPQGNANNNNFQIGLNMREQERNANNQEEAMNGWGNNNNSQRDEKEPSEDFLNDDENENGDTGNQGEWREVGEFDLNTR